MSPHSGSELLGRAVRWRGIRVGAVVDILFDLRGQRALGFEVLCEDGEHRFLPLLATELAVSELGVTSPLALVDGVALGFYRKRCSSFGELSGAPVRSNDHGPGTLTDVIIDTQGELESLLVRDAHGSRLVPPDEADLDALARSG